MLINTLINKHLLTCTNVLRWYFHAGIHMTQVVVKVSSSLVYVLTTDIYNDISYPYHSI